MTCAHDTERTALTFPPDPRTLTVRRMEWCASCGKLMSDREWKIPTPAEVNSVPEPTATTQIDT